MKIRTAKYIIKEGILNTYRNKLMSIASVGIVAAALIIFGIFYLISINLSNYTKALSDMPEMEVYCDPNLKDDQVAKVAEGIWKNGNIKDAQKVTKEEAFEKLKKLLRQDEQQLMTDGDDLWKGYDESFMPVSFIIKLDDPDKSSDTAEQLEKIDGVEKVWYEQGVIGFISKVTYWVRVISLFLITILLIIALFIISNTIKLTVFARRKEINIMKYIGATDWFIRWPFIIEGIIIGLVGALFAFVFVSYLYNMAEVKINKDLIKISFNSIRFVRLSEIGVTVIGIYSIIGVAVGSIGSIFSIRKYLHV
ncbi:MAG: permease-like cell division protein FtsX [Clostridia bacterium]|nr:permease-like cell division protein FtsX [Clostridia bacterium]